MYSSSSARYASELVQLERRETSVNYIFCRVQISEKERSLLDERIKRAAKNRPAKSMSATRLSTPAVVTSSPPTDDMEADYEEEQEEIVEPMETVPEL